MENPNLNSVWIVVWCGWGCSLLQAMPQWVKIKSTAFLLALWNNLAFLGIHNAMHDDQLNHNQLWNDLTKRFNRSLHAWYCVRQGNAVLLFGFSPVVIQLISVCHISMKERKQITDQIYNWLFLVEFLPFVWFIGQSLEFTPAIYLF